MPTFSPKPSDIQRAWFVVDADGLVLGRVATEVARVLRGKHKPIFAPHIDTGDHVIVINAVRRMLPRNALGRQMMTKLKVYAGDAHPHQAQQPVARQVEA